MSYRDDDARRASIARLSEVGPSGCWLWTGAKQKNGYPKLWDALAHRESYRLHIGPIPPGLELDHLCRVRHCVNPEHLEVVTHAENMRRGDSPSSRAAKQTHCKQGHPFDEMNTRFRARDRSRQCRACDRLAHAAKRSR